MDLYLRIKQLLNRLIPERFLFRYENSFRFLYYLFYIGGRYHCNICNKNIRSFVLLNNDKICPRCGSLQRARRLWAILDSEFPLNKLKILDFSPSRSLYRLLKKKKYNYTSSDLSGDFISDVSLDITNIDSPDSNFDLVICYHILEHVEDDRKAMEELKRVLVKNGLCIIQTPFREGNIYEDPDIKSSALREIHFGQADHVRIYSVSGLKERLENAGFKVETREYNEKADNKNGFSERELVLICSNKKV